MNRLQPFLTKCLGYRSNGGGGSTGNGTAGDVKVDIAVRMRILVDNVVRYDATPMVQNLIHHMARISLEVSVQRRPSRDNNDVWTMGPQMMTTTTGGANNVANSNQCP